MENSTFKKVQNYFTNKKEIAFAFLYGSQSNGSANALSDIDIAVYFYPEERHPVEFESENIYEAENQIWSEIEKVLKKDTELLVLNRAPAHVSFSAIRGIPLAINDWELYVNFIEVVSDVGINFMEDIIDDYKERERIATRIKSKNNYA